MALKINIDFKKTEDKGQVSHPVLKPVNPLWNKNVTPSPVVPRVTMPTSTPVVPRLQLPQVTTNRIQTMKESALEPQYAPKRLTLPTSDKLGFTGQRVTIPEIKKPLNYVSPLSDREQQIALGMIKPTEEERNALNIKLSSTPQSALAQGVFKGASFGLSELGKSKELRQAQEQAAIKNPNESIGGQILGSLLPQGIAYKLVDKAIKGTKIGSKLLGSANVGTKILASQAAQNMADVIIQTPIEVFNNIQSEKKFDQAVKDYAINRGIDVILNALMGGIEFTPEIKKALESNFASKRLTEIGVTPDVVEQIVKNNDQVAIQELKTKVNIKGKDYEVSQGEGQGSIQTSIKTPSLKVVEGQKLPSAEYSLGKRVGVMEQAKPQEVFSISDRSIDTVGKKNIPAYQIQNPEVKPFYKEIANELLGDLDSTLKGGRSSVWSPELNQYVQTGTTRQTSELISRIKDETGASYDEVKKGLERLIIDNGAENIAISKKIEVILDDALSQGYKTFDGIKVKPDPNYANAKALGEFEATAPPINLKSPLTKRTLTPIPTATKRLELPKLQKANRDQAKPEYTLVNGTNRITPTLKPIEQHKVESPKTDEELVKSFSDKVSGGTTKKKRKSFNQTVLDLRKEFEDDWLEIQSLETKVRGKVESAEKSPYAQGRLYKGAPEKANEFIRTELKPIIDRVVAKGGSQDDLGKYALAVHAKDVNKAGIKSGMSDEEIEAVIKQYGTPELEQARKELVAVSNKALDDLMASGRISKESVDAMRQKWPNYMPLSRSFDDDKVDFAMGLSQAFSNVSNPIKTLKGSSRVVIDPIESMTKNIYRITDVAERNKVGVQLANLAEEADDSIIRKLKSGEEIGRKNVVTVYVDGKKAQYEVEPEVFKAFNNLDKESSNMLLKWLAKPASVLRAGATLTPEFSLRNPFRDIQNAFVVSKSGFNPLLDFPAGLASTLKKDELYSQWLKEGGGYGNVSSMDRQGYKESLENVLKQPISKKFVNVITPKGFMAMLRAISDTTESATKVGEFKAALRSGATPQEAAFRSRDLMDFARAGSSVRQWNRVTAFMNASIQGKSKLIRAIKDNPTGVMTRMATSMVLPTVGIALANYQFASEEQKKTINDAPDWLKDTFWLIAVPGTDMVARFPKPFDISVVANGTERFLDYAMNKDKEAFDGFAKSTLKNMSIPIMMTGLLPTLEAMTNYSFFKDSSIIPMGEMYRQKKDQYDTKTSHVGRALAGVVGKFAPDSNFASPRIVDHVIKSSTAGLGQYGMDVTDMISNGLTKEKEPVKPALRLEQFPIAKAFMVSPFTSGKSMDYVYTMKDKLSKEKSSAKFNDVTFSTQKQRLLDYANDQAKALTDISKSIKEVEKSNMTSGQKRDEIVRLTKERNKISQDSADYIKKWDAK